VEKAKTMSARDAILGRILTALVGEADTIAPTYELWPAGTWKSPNDLFERFAEELQRVQGESKRYKSTADAHQYIQDLHQALGRPQTIFVDHPICRDLLHGYENASVLDVGMNRKQLAAIPLAIMPAEFLLADTGTAVVFPQNHAERLLCYLPDVSVLIAGADSVVAHLSDIWETMATQANDPELRGEMLLVTGPSRTADIEKKLVLGAHGPRRLVVILIEER
jgi:L-lactate dehydrogenase complex protein LldG